MKAAGIGRPVDRPGVIVSLIVLFVLGWVTFAFSLYDVGRYSIPLLYLAALPFCLRLTSRSICYLILPVASTTAAWLVAAFDGSNNRTASNAAQQALAILFAAGVAAIDWRKHLDSLVKVMAAISLPIVIYGGYQMLARVGGLPFAFLPVTNQQEYASGGLQRGWEKPGFPRASSLFVEPSEFGYFCLWLVVLGLAVRNPRWRLIMFGLGAAGILFSQSLSAVLGVGILLLVYLFTHRVSASQIRQLALLMIIALVAIVLTTQLLPEAFRHFSERIEQALTLDQRADSDRVSHIPENWRVFRQAPVWGNGLAMVSIDANPAGTNITYALLLMERGVLGTILFLLPWVQVGWRSIRLPAEDSGRALGILLTALNLYCFSTFATVYYIPFWFSLGIAASIALHTARPASIAAATDIPDYSSALAQTNTSAALQA